MKKIYFLAAALTVLAGAASCEKNSEISQPQPSGELRQVTIKAGSSQTKTYVEAGTLKWSDNDKLYIAPQSGTVAAAALNIKSGAGTASGTFEGQIDASIEDATELYGWCGGSWTYNEGTFSVDMPKTQTYVANGLAENAYPSIGKGTITSGISLSNLMGVLKLTVKGASSDLVKSISVSSATKNLAGKFTVTPGATPAISGGSTSDTLTLNIASPYVALSAEGVSFYVVVPPAEYAAGDLSVRITFSNDEYLNNKLADAVTVTAGKNTTAEEITVSEDKTGRRGLLNGHEYVLIKAKYDGTNESYLKWATQNLAVTESGKAKWKGTNYQIGDYFQWGASYNGYGITADDDKIPANLVIYTSFTNTCAGGASNAFTFKVSKKFDSASAPYYNSAYTKYTSTDGKTVLEQSDDVANIVLGNTWRMPTGGDNGEFKAMVAVTYWAWDDTDKGYYVFKPGLGTSGTANGYGNIAETDDKTKALLFFPAAGSSLDTDLSDAGSGGFYWSGTPFYSVLPDLAYNLAFDNYNWTSFNPASSFSRHVGLSVRPVSN